MVKTLTAVLQGIEFIFVGLKKIVFALTLNSMKTIFL